MAPLLPKSLLTAVLGVLLVLTGAHFQLSRGQPQLSEKSQISLITVLPGDPVYTFAGHSALRVRDPVHDVDHLYNYGTFEFDDPLFIPKFTYGYLRYHLSVNSTQPLLRFYQQQGRPVITQPLNLTRTQRSKVFQFLQRNARPENRYYQYDFFFDNCSTGIRDVLKETLGDEIDFSEAPRPTRSFRQLLDPYVASRPLLDFGFDLGLGLPADRRPTAWEGMFLPETLLEAFEHARVTNRETQTPLVARTDTVHWVSDYDATDAAFDWPFAVGIVGLVLAVAWTGRQAYVRDYPNRQGDALLLASVGTAGLVMCYLWFVSTYTVTEPNLNLLWAWPTHLVAAYYLVRYPSSTILRGYLTLTAGAAALFLLGWFAWPQDFHRTVAPITAALGIRSAWWALLLSDIGGDVSFPVE
jgi:hypothetical protein